MCRRDADCWTVFRRCRCAEKLHIECVPYVSLGEEEATGILHLMRGDPQRPLGILEQAKFVDELLSTHNMNVADVAEALSRSKAWVSARRNLLKEISPAVQEILFRGGFPVYSYMVTLRPFTRRNGVEPKDIEPLSKPSPASLSASERSTGGPGLLPRARVAAAGHRPGELEIGRSSRCAPVPEDPDGCNEVERALLQELNDC